MLLQWINFFPTWVTLLLMALIFFAISTLGFVIIQYCFPNLQQNEEQTQAAGVFLGLISGLYSILLAFIIVVLWQNYDKLTSVVSSEANDLAMMVRDANALPESAANEVKNAVGAFVKATHDKDWPLITQGKLDPRSNNALENLFHVIQTVKPSNATELTFFQEIVKNLNDVVQERRALIGAADGVLPNCILFVIVISGIFLVLYITLLNGINSRGYLFLLNIGVSGVIGLCIGLVIMFSYPFSGDTAISNKPFSEGVLQQFFPNSSD